MFAAFREGGWGAGLAPSKYAPGCHDILSDSFAPHWPNAGCGFVVIGHSSHLTIPSLEIAAATKDRYPHLPCVCHIRWQLEVLHPFTFAVLASTVHGPGQSPWSRAAKNLGFKEIFRFLGFCKVLGFLGFNLRGQWTQHTNWLMERTTSLKYD